MLKELLGTDAAVEKSAIAIGYMEEGQRDAALKLAARFRSEGKAVDLSLAPQKPKHFFKWSGQGNAAYAVFLGPDDVAKGEARLKNLETREETIITL